MLRGLYEHGIGAQIASLLTGYSASQLCWYAKDFGITPPPRVKPIDFWERLLPDDLRAEALRMRTKNEVAHRRKREPASPRIHHLVDSE